MPLQSPTTRGSGPFRIPEVPEDSFGGALREQTLARRMSVGNGVPGAVGLGRCFVATRVPGVGSLIKKRRKRMRKKKHKKMLKATRWQRRAGK